MKRFVLAILALAAFGLASPAFGGHGKKDGHAMDNKRIGALLKEIDADVQGKPGFWYVEHNGHPTYVITDEQADRMRIVVQIGPAEKLDRDVLFRMMQANFDSALDARYSIARGMLWSAYIHPLSLLSGDQFKAGFAQAITLAETWGTEYSSGGLRFGGGDGAGDSGQQ